MADLDDVQSYGQKLRNQREKLEEAAITEEDREAIASFIRHEDANEPVNEGTLVSHLNRLRLSAVRADVPLTHMDIEDVDELLFTLNHEHGLGEGTLRNYRKALRKFFRYRGEEWEEEITIGAAERRTVDPDDLLTDEEVDDLLSAANHSRDKAALAILADTGLRIGALASLRVRDVDLSGRVSTVSINEEANVKDASGTVPLTWSSGHVANWLDVHPESENPDAPLIRKLRMVGDDEDGALTYQYLSQRIKDIGEDAGIDTDRLNTHNFRHTAISRWYRQGMDEQKIKHRAFWAKDTSQFEVYAHVTDEEMNAEIAADYGIAPEDGEAARPDLGQCPQCQTPLRSGSRFCPGCGAPMTATAADAVEDVEDDVVETVANANGEKIEKALEFREAFKNDPELRSALLDEE